MNKAVIAFVAFIIIGGTAFVLTRDEGSNQPPSIDSSPTSANNAPLGNSQTSQKELDPNGYTADANIGAAVIATDKPEVPISIDDNIFRTTYLKIKKGTKVVWTNNGNLRHDVVSAESSPKQGLGSALLAPGQTYEFTFNELGVYEYFCTPHSNEMRGVITVVEQ